MRFTGRIVSGVIVPMMLIVKVSMLMFKFFMGVMLLFAVIANNAFRNYAAKR